MPYQHEFIHYLVYCLCSSLHSNLQLQECILYSHSSYKCSHQIEFFWALKAQQQNKHYYKNNKKLNSITGNKLINCFTILISFLIACTLEGFIVPSFLPVFRSSPVGGVNGEETGTMFVSSAANKFLVLQIFCVCERERDS